MTIKAQVVSVRVQLVPSWPERTVGTKLLLWILLVILFWELEIDGRVDGEQTRSDDTDGFAVSGLSCTYAT